jgi:hypothetical protein
MAITSSESSGATMLRMANGSHLDDAASPDAASIKLGFKPRHIIISNVTDRIAMEWFEGMTSAHAVQTVAAGTRTLETSGGVSVSDDVIGFAVIQNKQYRWVAYG